MYYCYCCCDGRWCITVVLVVVMVGDVVLLFLLWWQILLVNCCWCGSQQHNMFYGNKRCRGLGAHTLTNNEILLQWMFVQNGPLIILSLSLSLSLSLWFSDWQKVGINARCLIRCCFYCRNVFLHSAVVAADADDAAFIGSCLLWSVHSIPFEMPTNIPQGRQQMCQGLPPPPWKRQN